MQQRPDVIELTASDLVMILHQIAEYYKTTVFELLACYLYYLLDGNVPVGYPKKVIKKSQAERWHYKDPRFVVVDDELNVKFP